MPNIRWSLIAKSIVRILAITWLTLAGLIYAQQSRYIFVNTVGTYQPPSAAGLSAATEHDIATADGHRLKAWHVAAQPGKPTILYFHGNTGPLAFRAETLRGLVAEGYGLRAETYRGFPGSTGTPSEAIIISDAVSAYDRARASGLTPQDIVLFGESLGSGVALQVAAARDVAAIVLEAPYTSVADVARRAFPIFPMDLLITERFRSKHHIARIRASLFIMHGEKDGLIPSSQGIELALLSPTPTTLHLFPNADHVGVPAMGGIASMAAWLELIRAASYQAAEPKS